METTECENCEKEFEYSTGPRTPFTEESPPRLCTTCVDEEVDETLGKAEEPPGGWPRNSDIDRL